MDEKDKEIQELRKELKAAVNEMCVKCGLYREDEELCNWCKWSKKR